MEENNLNIPPDDEAIGKKISRIASQLIVPVLLPASSFLVGWLLQRRASIQLTQLRQEQEELAALKKDVETRQAQLGSAKPQREETSYERASRQRIKAAQDIMRQEERAAQKVLNELEELTPLLQERQEIFCNLFKHRNYRFKVEEKLRILTYSKPYDKALDLNLGMQNILKHDNHCGDVDTGGRKGCLMWVYMDFWKAKAVLLMHDNIIEQVKNLK